MRELEFDTITERLAEITFQKTDLVIGIRNGGVVPASLIAQQLSTPKEFIHINYRDATNKPQYPEPKLINGISNIENVKNIILVDDVAVTGKSLALAKEILKDYNITTCVFIGSADITIFPEITECVIWPWAKLSQIISRA